MGVALAKAGHDIAFSDIAEDEAVNEATKLLEVEGTRARLDIVPDEAVASHAGLMAEVKTTLGRLDLFVSNAGIGAPVRGDCPSSKQRPGLCRAFANFAGAKAGWIRSPCRHRNGPCAVSAPWRSGRLDFLRSPCRPCRRRPSGASGSPSSEAPRSSPRW
ncbi:MAG: hypothetical protein ACOVOI_21135 [Hyphomicrobiales bacterium]